MTLKPISKKQIDSKHQFGELYYNEYTSFVECDKCKTAYPILNNKIKCNGQEIINCPYCEVSK